MKAIKNVLVSVYYKDGLDELIHILAKQAVNFYSTGGTQKFIESLGYKVNTVEGLTAFPEILGGRVKTLHPKIFGGILARRDNEQDQQQLVQFEIPEIDMVIVDLYPFEETVASTTDEQTIIEKIDIGGISLIRAAAKNFKDTLIVSNKSQYATIANLLAENKGATALETRKLFAKEAFAVSSHYDTLIYRYFAENKDENIFKQSYNDGEALRYGENPHQKGFYFGNLEEVFDILNGKALSYNNLVDIDAAVRLMTEFTEPTFAVLKHTNSCGVASRNSILEAWQAALAGDPVSAFGGVLIANRTIDEATALEIDKLFFEVLIAPEFDEKALDIFTKKKNRILLKQKLFSFPNIQYKSLLNGAIVQDFDTKIEVADELKSVTKLAPSSSEIEDLLFANKIAKHLKSNTIVLAKNKQLLGMGCGQTSRVDALQQAIHKAQSFGFDLKDSVMASDAFFPFPDCVEIANNVGIKTVIQPGGSIKDQLSIDYCDDNEMKMVTTGIRHFKH
ncbi:MAG TPA: bifunctional phosphoribosylaminoimidazolecarboxamide formyltransferase/IMP cyclohydrolase [Chitinophagales bacterium]|nr:bifunctional phosphoribosylaminoimidazolecarboxamide formyltransferase/IMP cyclohydrolase [Chitinophagales bacterium]HMZ93429.1 bifunctional phosphoribosylaminoimidazolecarboxamide formyltransferase/IMP cyclohydrolase [Chitinophagales bacterium]HNG26508.1 bifunctional phosphoribosylaminoimidazolecarboxamide formyltransferase/IMP cyclohydrolase [Chitinophagales bacterium]HNJ11024.1 bifunctional phosphoribosylaminoimidazolecarboxamide formyltransferase/IMP cyclohydrolase [Chitinophagales bacter